MSAPIFNFLSISRKESPESQRKQAFRNKFSANTMVFKWRFQSQVESENAD